MDDGWQDGSWIMDGKEQITKQLLWIMAGQVLRIGSLIFLVFLF